MVAVLRNTATRWRKRARAWAAKRQGTDPQRLELESRRVYILPTRAGLIFAVIVFTMLLGAMNYNNNMGFALTFLLAGIGIVSIHHCHHNLTGLLLQAVAASPVFAGDDLRFRFTLENPSRDTRWQLKLGWDGGPTQVTELEPGERGTVTLCQPTHKRGRIKLPRLRVSTQYPLGLFQAWAWVNMDLDGLAYPQPAARASGTATGAPGRRDQGRDTSGDDDYSGMRDWREGDPPRRIAWKVLARTGQKLVSEYHGGAPMPRWIDWESEPAADDEERLSRLARRVLDADDGAWEYGLRMPGGQVGPGVGPDHRHRCLELLALHGRHEARA